jgi:beta-N-acetylhexosaminidase
VDAAPAGYSRAWLQDALREEIGFAGAIFSDDLSMAGADAGEDLPQRATRALEAGCDMALVCNDRPGAARVVEGLPVRDRPASVARLMRMHGHAAAGIDGDLTGTSAWAEARARVDALVQAAGHEGGTP